MAIGRVVFDAHLLLDLSAHADPQDWKAWPDVPPVSDEPTRDCMGVIASSPRHGHDVQLIVSRELLAHVAETLKTIEGLGNDDINGFLKAVLELAEQAVEGRRVAAERDA